MLLDLIKQRTSIRKFSKKQVHQDIIHYILEAGRLSPSGGNEQSWRFGVIHDKEVIQKIADATYNQTWITSADFLIVLCTCTVPKDLGGRNVQKARFPEHAEAIDRMNNDLYAALHAEEHQTKIPGTHMVLAAQEHGVFSTWISYFNVQEVSKILELQSCLPSEIIAFGYPETLKSPTNKKKMNDIIFYNKDVPK